MHRNKKQLNFFSRTTAARWPKVLESREGKVDVPIRHEPIIRESGRSWWPGLTNESSGRKINKTSELYRNAPRRHQSDSAASSCECFSKTGSKARMIVSLHCFCVWLDSERVVFQEGNFARFNRIWARLIHFAYLPEPVQPYWKVGARLY